MIASLEEALKVVKSGDNVFIHSVAAAPQYLINGLVARADELRNVTIYHKHTEGEAPYADPKYIDNFNIKVFFVGKNTREAVQTGRASYIPMFLSEIPILFRKRVIPLDIALVNVSPPDEHGYCSLGVSVSISRAAVDMAKIVIAQVNNEMPRTFGDGLIHMDNIDMMVYKDEPIHVLPVTPLTPQLKMIGKHVASLIEDGATIQTGVGTIPDAVLPNLIHHKNLGIHTEIFSDGILPLIERGVINGSKKVIHPGTVLSSFAWGSKKLYDFINNNPLFMMRDSSYVNNAHLIQKNPKVTAINSAIEVDLTGQVCADSIGRNIYSGVGGQMDFIRGASLSEGGKPIIALPATTSKGESRIVAFLKEGAGVVTTRSHVHYVVTEWGVANLYGKTLRERAKELIEIAEPVHREQLEKDFWKQYSILNKVY